MNEVAAHKDNGFLKPGHLCARGADRRAKKVLAGTCFDTAKLIESEQACKH